MNPPNYSVDKLYYDITFTNLAQDQTVSPVVNFTETRNTPFILDPEQYYLSIIRFSLDCNSLPMFIPSIQPDQPNINLTTYYISLSYKPPVIGSFEVFVSKPIIFEPQNLIASLPAPPSSTFDKLQDNSSGYYYIYTYQFWIYLINKTFKECYDELVALTFPNSPASHAPVMEFDTSGKIGVINADVAFYESALPNPITIYFNNNLGQLFSSFPFYINSASGFLNYKLAVSVFGGSTLIKYPTTNPTYTAIQCWQEYSTASDWSPVQSIVFTSTLLPVVSNQLSNPIILYNGGAITSNGNNNNFAQIITDMIADNNDYKPFVLYNPQAEYRLVELIGNTPLYSVDIQIYWKNRFGQLIPFRLTPQGSANIKIMFTKKK